MTDSKNNNSTAFFADCRKDCERIDTDSLEQKIISKENPEQEIEEWKLRKNMENCAAFMARMLMKYGKDVLTEVDGSKENEKSDTPFRFA